MPNIMPEISIVIPTFNSKSFIQACLDSVFKQSYQDFEVIIIDNSSDYTTSSLIRQGYPRVRLIENKQNLGAAKARNQGIQAAQGRWILTLDCDVTLEKSFLSKVSRIIKDLPSRVGILQPKILKADRNRIYSTGIFLSTLRRFYDIGRDKIDNGQFNSSKYIFGACSAAAFYRRQMFEQIKENTGYFDERFFFLAEDVDLSWRAQRNGWKTLYCPEAVCYHLGDSSNTSQKMRQYLCFRNRYYSIIKNESIKKTFLNSFLLSVYDSPRFFYFLFNNPYIFRAIKEIFGFLRDECKRRNYCNENI